ncbi:MAG: hypothetical protein ACREUX_04555, partial [Burkholderiales bacterium]
MSRAERHLRCGASGHARPTATSWVRVACSIALTCACASASARQLALDSVRTAADLRELSLEQLLDVEVTSVAARPQRVAQSAASIYVIRQDDIRRSGAT